MNSKDRIISKYKDRLEGASQLNPNAENLSGTREAVLLGELQIAQLELEMQNDELGLAVELLQLERAKFEGFFNMAPTCYFITDGIGIVCEVNQVALELLKVAKAKLLGQRIQSFIVEEDYHLFNSFFCNLLPEKNRQTAELRLRDSLGNLFHVSIEGIAVDHDLRGTSQCYLTLTDVTQRRTAELKLIDATKRLELTLSSSGIGTWSVEPVTGALSLDQFSLGLLGLDNTGFNGDPNLFFKLVHDQDRQQVKEKLRLAFLKVDSVEMEFRLRPEDQPQRTIMLKALKIEMESYQPHLVGIIVDITEARALEELKSRLEKEKKKISYEATIVAQETERERISSALHDSVCQLLYGIKLGLQNLRHQITQPADFNHLNGLILQAIKETRDLSYELTPSILRDFGLVAAITDVASRLSTNHFRITKKIDPDADRLPLQLQLSIFRIIQELINNTIKHAGASTSKICLSIENHLISLSVSDNGLGFRVDQSSILKGSGIRAIKNRIFLLDGSIAIHGGDGGTTVTIRIKHNE